MLGFTAQPTLAWHYAKLPLIFGDNVFTAKASTENELAQVLTQIETHKDKMCFIEVMMDSDDCPENLRKLAKACEAKNKG